MKTIFVLAVAGILVLPAYAGAESSLSGAFGGAMPVGAEMLNEQRGGTETHVLNASTANGTVRDNVAYDVSTGGNWIGGGSLAGAAGIPLVVQNSGNNVLIQNSTIVNMRIQ